MDLAILLKQTLNGISVILILMLIAVGLTVIFGMMRVINMAHGDLFMLGAYTLYLVVAAGYSFWLGVVLAPVVVGVIGVGMERICLWFLYGRRDLSSLLATWGFGIIFQQAVKLLVGPEPRFVPSPIEGEVSFLGVNYPVVRVLIMAISVAILLGVFWVFLKTHFGLRARATIVNSRMASALGIHTSRIFLLTFAFGAALAGTAGALMTPLIAVVPTMGIDFIVRPFFVVIIGGLGNIFGVLGGGLIVGGTESLFTASINTTVSQIIVFAAVVIIMLVRPRGLLGGRSP